jgi:uncharacterized protein (TIGR00369 family)
MLKFMGLRWVEIDDEHAVSEIPFGPNIALKLGGVFGGALLAMADLTANNLCRHAVNPSGAPDGPNTVTTQVSAHLVRNADSGTIRAEARWVHKGRTTRVVETAVRDEVGRLLMLMTSTHCGPAARPRPSRVPDARGVWRLAAQPARWK